MQMIMSLKYAYKAQIDDIKLPLISCITDRNAINRAEKKMEKKKTKQTSKQTNKPRIK